MDLDHSNTSDHMLIGLWHDWSLANLLFGTGQAMLEAIDKEIKLRGLEVEPYDWTPPREYEAQLLSGGRYQ